MKRLIKNSALFIAAVALIMNTASAKTPPTIKSSADLEKAIKEVVDYPESVKTEELSGNLNIIFKIDNEGKIELKRSTGNPEFSKHVSQRLEELKVENPDLYGRFFSKKISFELRK